jgi:DNA-binding NarL/FixJ family response regulator
MPDPTHLRLPPHLRRVAELVVDGLTTKEIADRAGLADGTVKEYISAVYKRAAKAGVRINCRAHLTGLVMRGDLVLEV